MISGAGLHPRRQSPSPVQREAPAHQHHDLHDDIGGRKYANFPMLITLAVVLICTIVISLPQMLAWAGFQGAKEHIAKKAARRSGAHAQKPREPARRVGGTSSRRTDGFDVIIIPGGGQTPSGPPDHVKLRLQKAKELYDLQKPRPWILTTGRGTTHKPCPRDDRGFEVDEASMNAQWLINEGVSPSHILTETASWETIGNAYFARIMHVDHLGASRLAIINNWWHMPRTKAVFGHVFQVPPFPQDAPPYDISWFEVGDGLRPEVLKLRLDKENATLPRFLPGGHWQAETSTLPELHKWLYREHASYAAKRFVEGSFPASNEEIDPRLAESY